MKRFLMLLTALMLSATTAQAVPTQMNYQGQLFLNGSPTSGPVGITFRMYDAETGGTLLWTETNNVTVTGGLFTTILGDGTVFPANLFTAQIPWLEMEVNGTALTPRTQFKSVPYTFQAQRADSANWSNRADTANVALSGTSGNELWSTNGTDVWRPNGGVGINTVPQVPLHMRFGSPTDANTAARFEFTGAGASDFELIRSSSENGQTPRTFRIRGGNDYDVFTSFELGTATDHPLRFVTNSAERMRITKVGNVGIGTISPTALLHVYSPTHALASILVEDAGGAIGGSLHLKHGGPDIPSNHNLGALDFLANISGTEKIMARVLASSVAASTQQSKLHFLTAGGADPVERMRIDENGYVGINTTTPASRLHIAGMSWTTGDDTGLPSSAGKGVGVGYARPEAFDGGYVFAYDYATGTPKNLILNRPGGYVGIETANPAYKLDVAGSVRSSSGGFVFPDGSTQVTAAGTSLWASSGNDAYNTNAGNVFIGGTSTGNSTSKLQIIAPSPQILLRDANAGVNQTIGVDGNGLSIHYDGGQALTVSRPTGNVGIGTPNPTAKLHVTGSTGHDDGVLKVRNNGTGMAVFGETNSDRTLFGGVNGKAYVPGGSGVVGEVSSPGVADNPGTPEDEGGATVGVYGRSRYQGQSVGGAEIGVLGWVESEQSTLPPPNGSSVPVGVFGWATKTTGKNAGVWGETESPDGYGVYSVGRMVVNGDFTASSNAAQGYNGNIKTQSGDLVVSNSGKGLILKAPNGTCFRLTVNNAGNLATTLVPCP